MTCKKPLAGPVPYYSSGVRMSALRTLLAWSTALVAGSWACTPEPAHTPKAAEAPADSWPERRENRIHDELGRCSEAFVPKRWTWVAGHGSGGADRTPKVLTPRDVTRDHQKTRSLAQFRINHRECGCRRFEPYLPAPAPAPPP